MTEQEVHQALLQLGLAIRRQDRDAITRWQYAAGRIIVTKQRAEIPAHLAKLFTTAEPPSGVLEAIERAIKADGWKIQTRRLSEFTLGLTATRIRKSDGAWLQRNISVVPYIDNGQRALTLLHEWTHGILHQTHSNLTGTAFGKFNAWQMEIEAEATSWIVGRALGINSDHAPKYFAQRNLSTLQLMTPATIKQVHTAAEYILSRLPVCVSA